MRATLQSQVHLKSSNTAEVHLKSEVGSMAEPAAMLTIGQVALRSGVAPSALRFYEAEGLIASERSDGNQRRYDRAVLRRVAVIQAGRAAGIPLAAIGSCARAAARRPAALQARLGAPLARLARGRRGAHRAARARARRPRVVHRLRLPLAALLPAVQPGRPRGAVRAGRALPARATSPSWRSASSGGLRKAPLTYSPDETGAHERVQRRRDRHPDHDPRARVAAARRDTISATSSTRRASCSRTS